jgi:hypothetical protein
MPFDLADSDDTVAIPCDSGDFHIFPIAVFALFSHNAEGLR